MDGEKISDILLYMVIGDALGSSMNGLSREHIASVFKRITGYIDPMPALKNRAFKWEKPGLYSSISQLNILFALLLLSKKRFTLSPNEYADIIAHTPAAPDSETGIFRRPDAAAGAYIKSLLQGKKHEPFRRTAPELPLLMLHIGLLAKSPEAAVRQALSLAASVCIEAFSVAGAGIYAGLISALPSRALSMDNIREASVESTKASVKLIGEEAASMFDSGINPLSLKHAAEVYLKAFSLCGEENSDELLISLVNEELKASVTRLTVPHPLALLSGSFNLIYRQGGRPETLFAAAAQGGAAGLFTAAAGSFAGMLNPAADIPDRLAEELVNKKRIMKLSEALGKQRTDDDLIADFLASEQSLTAKFLEELKAKIKNDRAKPKQPMKNERLRTEEALARHIAESWTKIDKAKWKKEKQRRERRGS